ncbi:MAG: TRAP transporter substrate-binding protein [Pseudomonadota bacterium]
MVHFQRALCRAGASLVAIAVTSAAFAQDYTFSIQHFLSPKAPAQTMLIEPWARAVEESSDGRITFEIFPAMSLGGKPPELYSQVRDGVVDVVWTVTGYTPGTFPRTEVFELPGVHKGDARATNLAIQDMMAALAPELEDIHPILVHVHTGNALHLASGNVASLADIAGLKIRSPSRTGAWMVEEMGAEPVGMPVPALPQALSKKTVDAGLVPFEVAIPLGLADLTSASVDLHDGARFGTATFLFAMNKDSYESLPEDLQRVIDEQSGRALAEAMGTAWNKIEPVGVQRALDAGNSVTSLSAEATAEFGAPFAATVQRWADEANANGIDADALLGAARAAIAVHSQ